MLQITKGLPATIYKVQLRTLAGAIATPLLTIPESSVQPGFYSIAVPTTPPLAAGKYLAFYYRVAGTETVYLGAEKIQWDGTNLVVDLASSQDLAVIKNAIAQLPAPDNTGISVAATAALDVRDRLTVARAAKLDNVSQFDAATALVSIGKVGAIAVTSPNDFKSDPAVLARIDSNSVIARKAFTNKAVVDLVTSIVTIMDDNGITPVFKLRMLNATGQPNVEQVVSREVVPL
jgi:hypothetical protein